MKIVYEIIPRYFNATYICHFEEYVTAVSVPIVEKLPKSKSSVFTYLG